VTRQIDRDRTEWTFHPFGQIIDGRNRNRVCKAILAAIVVLGVVWSGSVLAEEQADSDATPVPICDNMPVAATIEVMSKSEAEGICRAMGLLEGVRVKDIRAFSKASALLSSKGCKGTTSDIAKQLVEIIRLRGLYDKRDRWFPTLDIVFRTYVAFNGVVAPSDAIAFLRSAGPVASKGLSDDGFKTMLIVIKEQKQQGDD
jgi:hypothetical protein